MKLKSKPVLLRTIIGEVEHKGKVYEVTVEEIGEDDNDFEIVETESGEEIDSDSELGRKLVEFFLIETEDIEQFL